MVTTGSRRWRWPELDHATAAALVADRVPGASGELTPLGSGDFCLAFKLDSRVIRVARHAEAAVALRREVCTLGAIAHALPLPVPRPTYHSPEMCPPFAVHEEIIGEVLTREGWMDMPVPARRKAAGDLADFLKALHRIPVGVGLGCGLARLDVAELARELRRETADTLDTLLDGESRRRLDAALARWSSPRSSAGGSHVLLHCDIAPGHLLCDPATGGLTGVIDFGDIAVGDAARDFIFVYEDYGPEMLSEVLNRYAGENAPSLLSEIRKWYLLEALSWTLDMRAARRDAEMKHGLAEIGREIRALPT